MSSGEGARWYECLNLRDIYPARHGEISGFSKINSAVRTVPLNVVLFRARGGDDVPVSYRRPTLDVDSPAAHEQQRRNDSVLANSALIRDINATKQMYVSPGGYPGGAVRLAVSNWMTALDDDGADLKCVKGVLQGVMMHKATVI